MVGDDGGLKAFVVRSLDVPKGFGLSSFGCDRIMLYGSSDPAASWQESVILVDITWTLEQIMSDGLFISVSIWCRRSKKRQKTLQQLLHKQRKRRRRKLQIIGRRWTLTLSNCLASTLQRKRHVLCSITLNHLGTIMACSRLQAMMASQADPVSRFQWISKPVGLPVNA